MITPTQKFFAAGRMRKKRALHLPLASDLLDISGNSNHASMIGVETHVDGGLQTSVGNYASIPNKTLLDFGTGSLEYGCDFKLLAANTGGVKGIIGKSIFASAIGRYAIYLNGSNIVAASQLTSVNPTNTFSVNVDGRFHSIKCICDRTLGNQSVYIDGILASVVSFTPSNDNVFANKSFYIGAYGAATGTGINAGSEFNGIIKNVYVIKF